MKDIVYWHALNMVPGLGPRTFKLLIDHFKTAKQAWEAEPSSLYHFFQRKTNTVEQLIAWKKQFNLEESFNDLSKHNIGILTFKDDAYPSNLRNIHAFPPVLYFRGFVETLKQNSLAIVGSRKATAHGRQISEKIAFELANNGFVIVSGMARGIDSYAHWGALKAKGKTVAVLGCGLDVVYPLENKKLMNLINKNGVVISEFPPGTPPEAKNFPRRNRIISGLSKGVILVEAAEKSGSLITAELALQQGRDVFAIPGSIFNPYSKGTNFLIQQGAKLVQDTKDILEEYNIITRGKTEAKISLDSVQESIMKLFSTEPLSIDEIVNKTKLRPEQVLSQLSILEIKGIIKQLPGQRYINTL
jgi:DNA processing protein